MTLRLVDPDSKTKPTFGTILADLSSVRPGDYRTDPEFQEARLLALENAVAAILRKLRDHEV